MMIFSVLVSSVAKDSCGVDLVCLLLEETMDSPGAQLQSLMYLVLMHLQI
jgi:hypothetical protein